MIIYFGFRDFLREFNNPPPTVFVITQNAAKKLMESLQEPINEILQFVKSSSDNTCRYQ